MKNSEPSKSAPGLWTLRIAVDVHSHEVRAMLWAWLMFFFIMSSYYVLRPIRDQLGSIDGAKDLPWMYTGTFIAMLIAVPLYSGLVARLPRRVFIPLVYQFFAAGSLVFYVLLQTLPESDLFAVAVAFFIFVSVYSLFVVTVFWGLMADTFRNDQGKRLFGFITFAASTGGIIGPAAVSLFVERIGSNAFLPISVVLLESAVLCAWRFGRASRQVESEGEDVTRSQTDRPLRGGMLAGFVLVFRSPYLMGICAYLFFYTFTSTVLYSQQADLVDVTFPDRDERTQFFASLDLAVNVLALLIQAAIVGRVMKWIGIGWTLVLLPLFTAIGFAAMALTQTYAPSDAIWLGSAPIVTVFVGFQVARRAANYGFARPAREVLFTVVSREAKYKAKSFIDTAVYRGGDLATVWAYAGVQSLGAGLAAIAWLAVPVSAVWAGVAFGLGMAQAQRARNGPPTETTADSAR